MCQALVKDLIYIYFFSFNSQHKTTRWIALLLGSSGFLSVSHQFLLGPAINLSLLKKNKERKKEKIIL